MTLSELFANIENTRGQIKRRGLRDLLNIMGEHVAQNIAGPGLLAAEHARSVVPEVREPARQRMTDTALGLLGAIKAYHGSPHKFDKFSMDRIGTGEGAQAYGHGLYFAEHPEVATQYQRGLSTHEWKLDGKQLPKVDKMQGGGAATPSPHELRKAGFAGSDDELRALAYLTAQDSVPAAIAKLEEMGKPARAEYIRKIQDRLEAARGGQMYEVSLRWPDAAREAKDPLGPQHFLDWDKPLSQQPESVRKLISIEPSGKYGGYSLKINGKEVTDPLETREEAEQLVKNLGYKGEDVYRNIIRSDSSNGMRAGSDYLRSLGIPGIRYLDGGSRAAGEGTANYVAFDDALVDILKRNGINIR